MEIFVSNIPFASTEDDIRRLFGFHGNVERVSLITDRQTGRSRGYGFVSMPDDDEAQAAIEGLNGIALHGRTLRVNPARPRQPRSNRLDG